jgi:hypothetical protein
LFWDDDIRIPQKTSSKITFGFTSIMLEPVMDYSSRSSQARFKWTRVEIKTKGDLNIERDVQNVFANLC